MFLNREFFFFFVLRSPSVFPDFPADGQFVGEIGDWSIMQMRSTRCVRTAHKRRAS